MTADQAIHTFVKYLRLAILIALSLMLVAIVARQLGIVLPIRTMGHVELAYLAGAYWLTK